MGASWKVMGADNDRVAHADVQGEDDYIIRTDHLVNGQ